MIVWRSVYEESRNWTSVYVFMWKNYRNGSCSGGYVQYRFHRAQVQGVVNHDVHWKGKKAFLNGKYWNCGNFFCCSWKYIETEVWRSNLFFFNQWTSNISKVWTPQGPALPDRNFLWNYPWKFRVKSSYKPITRLDWFWDDNFFVLE